MIALALLAAPASAQDELGDFLEATEAETVPVEQTATDAPIAVSDLKKAGGTQPEITGFPEEVPGLKEVQATGAQGQPMYQFVVRADGSITDVEAVQSTGSDELDAVGAAYIETFEAKVGRDADGNPVDVLVRLPLSLWIDTLEKGSLGEKTCAAFVTEADWHLATFPDSEIKKMRIWNLATGAAVLTSPSGFGGRRLDAQTVYDTCKAEPDRIFFRVFAGLPKP
ncbi:energy transducer TonB [Erythrobacter crassostreae]|uniref:Energy transducer TonB n=1 Tax=Erythrobacter crassostreae TaxID=2828328 RepID=A0A9X1JND2_9SPHN|nr:energy transducer TonB [Erythrobacter crassostrea]MBV7259598.1 energy transducer TonB [Erythrobacter crassostrea]